MRTGNRIHYLAEALKRIVSITTKYTAHNNGIRLRWLNHDVATARHLSPNELKSLQDVDQIIAKMKNEMRGPTRLGMTLQNRILEPFLLSKLKNPDEGLTKPILITIITDGEVCIEYPRYSS